VKYRITHTTQYHYSQAAELCQNEARLQPRDFWRQQRRYTRFEILPAPVDFHERLDYFGNHVTYFAIQQAHTQLVVTAVSELTVSPGQRTFDTFNPLSWEQARNLLQEMPTPGQSQRRDQELELPDAGHYVLDSPMAAASDEISRYGQSSFLPNRPLVEVVRDLNQRIYSDFIYDPSFTTIATPLSDVLSHRRGVCQDFAHLAIACLRAYGIAARYVSGYIETRPAPGRPRSVGADASHAWVSVYMPGAGWLDFDPTNNTMPTDQHITLAWGRDYSDVTPLKGIAYGGGQHSLSVSVDVLRLE
jgi:transglutaminase-like putative cysteine protease